MIPLLCSKTSDPFLLVSLAGRSNFSLGQRERKFFLRFVSADISKKLAESKKDNGEISAHLSKELAQRTQPLLDSMKDLSKKIDAEKDHAAKTMNENFHQIDKKLDEILHDSPKRNELEKNLQPFSQLLRSLKESKIDRSRERGDNRRSCEKIWTSRNSIVRTS